jgi:hypothetical protein
MECTDEPLCILEHDAVFVGPLTDDLPAGVTQISAHRTGQIDTAWYEGGISSGRHTPEGSVPDFSLPGVIPHPFTKTVGTSGYVITPDAAARMAEHIRACGVAYADYLRRDIVGDLWLTIPQPVESWWEKDSVNYY